MNWKEAGKFFSHGLEEIICRRKYIKEIILSIWSSHGNKNSPGYIACNLQIDGIIHRFNSLIKIPNEVNFFPKQQLNHG